jgi:hypothetical protein
MTASPRHQIVDGRGGRPLYIFYNLLKTVVIVLTPSYFIRGVSCGSFGAIRSPNDGISNCLPFVTASKFSIECMVMDIKLAGDCFFVSSSNQTYMPHIGSCEVMSLRAMSQSGNECTLKAAHPVIY